MRWKYAFVGGANMKKLILVFSCAILLLSPVFSDMKSDYVELLKKQDFVNLEKLLDKWKGIESTNPEVYIGYFNLHLWKAMKSGVAIDMQLPDTKQSYMTITDPKTGKTVGYMHDKTFYDDAETKIAIDYLNQGLAYGPDRLDMYFGKIHVLMEIHNYNDAYTCLDGLLTHGIAINSNWLWGDNKKIENGKMFLLQNIQDYYNVWIRENTVETNTYVKKLSKKQIELYPDHSWAYSNICIAINRLNTNEDEFGYLKKAYDIDPQDIINVNNLANYYRQHGNKVEAIKLYRIMAVSEDQRASDDAKKYLKELGEN
jgi:tetratricopeptide (TPR) repeat protein